MTPVISPWVFYLMPISEKLSVLFTILSVIGITVFVVILGIYLNELDYMDDEDAKKFKRIFKTTLILAMVFILLSILMPSEETLTKMIVAQNVTCERVEAVSDTVVTVYNDIMALFGEASGG